jgi:tetratricopeptide (TPR) repeat protein
LYIAFEPTLPSRADASGVWESLLTLHDALGTAGVAVTLSFVAYILGAISEALGAAIPTSWAGLRSPRLFLGELRQRRLLKPFRSGALLGWKGTVTKSEIIQGRVALFVKALDAKGLRLEDVAEQMHLARHSGILPSGLTPLQPVREMLGRAGASLRRSKDFFGEHSKMINAEGELSGIVNLQVLTDFNFMRTRMLGKENELFSAIDRLHGEAEFRLAIAPALMGLGGALAWRATWWLASITLATAIVLVLQGRDRTRRCNDALLDALRVGRTAAPSIDRFDEATQQFNELEISVAKIELAALQIYHAACDNAAFSARDRASAHFKAGVLLERQGDDEAATGHYRAAARLLNKTGPIDEVHLRLGLLLERRAELDEAVA